MRELYHFNRFAMNAAAPKGRPAADLLTNLAHFRQTLKKVPDPPCLGEALRRMILIKFL